MSNSGRRSGPENASSVKRAMTKICGNKECLRAGQRLGLSEFPLNRQSTDGRYYICKDCAALKTEMIRVRKGKKPRYSGVQRKPMVVAQAFTASVKAFCKVYDAISQGCRTRQAIQRKTQLSYDLIGEAIVELVFDCKAVKIVNRDLVLIESESVRAA